MPGSQKTVVTITTAVRRSGLTEEIVHECVERRLVQEPFTDAELAELRRIRRLQELGLNLPGIEVVLHMRRRILRLQAEMAQLQSTYDSETETRWQRTLPRELED